jgi:hypothetical protein
MNLATLPAAYARPDSNGPRRGRSSTIPFFPERNTSTAIAPEQAMIEQHKHRIFSSFRTVFSFKLPLRLEFEMLKRTWKGATRFHSSVSYMTSHPAYQRIIGMGWAAVPSAANRIFGLKRCSPLLASSLFRSAMQATCVR